MSKQAVEETPPAGSALESAVGAMGLDLLYNVEMSVTVELGRTRLPIRELLNMRPGRVLELDRGVRAPVDVLVNNTLVARGEVVVVDDELGVRVTEIVSNTSERPAAG